MSEPPPPPQPSDDTREEMLMPPASPRAPALLLDDDGLPLQVPTEEPEPEPSSSSADDYTRSLSPEPETEAEREEREAAATNTTGGSLSPSGGALGVIDEAASGGGADETPHVSGPGAPSGGQMESTGAEMDDAPEPVSLEESVQLGVQPSTPEGQAAQQGNAAAAAQRAALTQQQRVQDPQQMLSPFTPGNRVVQGIIDPTAYAQLRRSVPRPKVSSHSHPLALRQLTRPCANSHDSTPLTPRTTPTRCRTRSTSSTRTSRRRRLPRTAQRGRSGAARQRRSTRAQARVDPQHRLLRRATRRERWGSGSVQARRAPETWISAVSSCECARVGNEAHSLSTQNGSPCQRQHDDVQSPRS